MHISMYIYLFLDYAKLALFSAETLRKTHLSAGYRYFFTKFAADFNKTELDKVIGGLMETNPKAKPSK